MHRLLPSARPFVILQKYKSCGPPATTITGFRFQLNNTINRTMSIKSTAGEPNGEEIEAPGLKLYSLGTPNGEKITILLALLGVKYHYKRIDISTNVQKEEWFLKLNPNGRIPTLVDIDEHGELYSVMESAAILQYLGEKYDKEHKYYYSVDAGKLYWDQQQWLAFHVASHAPYQGQANHFLKFAKEDVPYGKKRYLDETKRVFGVFERRLKENNGWLVGDHLNIADVGAYSWIHKGAAFVGINVAEEFPVLYKWVKVIDALPEVQEGLKVDPLF